MQKPKEDDGVLVHLEEAVSGLEGKIRCDLIHRPVV